MELSDQQAALHGVLVVHRGLEDLCEAPLSGTDLVLEAAGMRQSVLDLTGAAPGAVPDYLPPCPVPEPAAGASLESVWTARWPIGHQVHVLFNVCAAVAVADATRHLRHGDSDAALLRVADATVYVRGFPAAMTHASTVRVDYYMAAIRHTMAPPSVDVPLSGRQHRGYKLFRAAMKDLLSVLPDSYDQLGPVPPERAEARDALLEADIVDVNGASPSRTRWCICIIPSLRNQENPTTPWPNYGTCLIAAQPSTPPRSDSGTTTSPTPWPACATRESVRPPPPPLGRRP
ncbi:hypothetical protein ABWJ92_36175 [Streptomyces sp. NPDC000609]|uniref:hypothetical protein n=1 Tax=Streptomyces sp. NPDC000609 TaxID=3160957 RepID=UPI0033921560